MGGLFLGRGDVWVGVIAELRTKRIDFLVQGDARSLEGNVFGSIFFAFTCFLLE